MYNYDSIFRATQNAVITMYVGYVIAYLIGAIILGCITKSINRKKGYDGGFAWGFWLGIIGIIGIIVVACRSGRQVTTFEYTPRYGNDSLSSHNSGWKCVCGTTNSNGLTVCPICKRSKDEQIMKTVQSVVTTDKIECPHCGAKNNKSNAFCFACGKSITMSEPAQIPEPEVNAPVPVISEVIKPAPVKSEPSESTLNDNLQLLEKLAKLHEQGILTDDEFAQKKAVILEKI